MRVKDNHYEDKVNTNRTPHTPNRQMDRISDQHPTNGRRTK